MNGLVLSLNNSNNGISSQITQLFRRSNLCNINVSTINTSNNAINQMNINSIVNSISSAPVDLSRFSKQSFGLEAAQQYCNQRGIKLTSNCNKNSNIKIIQDEEKRARLSAIVKNISTSSNDNDKNSSVKPTITEDKKEIACIHHLWNQSSWTSSFEKNCDWNCKLCPNLTIIEPNSVDNIQSLAHMNRHGNRKSKRKVGIFTEFLFFSHKATSALCTKLGFTKENCDTPSIYQFEARYFQYSVLAKNIRFCKDYRHAYGTNNNNKGKSYMIFKFGSISQVTGTELYAICEENNRSKQQPWICQHIFTLDEMLQFFNLDKQALNVRQGFLNAMNIKSNCVTKVFDVDCECRSQTMRICKMLDHSYQRYVREVETKCRNGENYSSGWISDDLVSTRSNSSSHSTGSTSGMSLLSLSGNGNGSRSLCVTDSDCNSVCSSRGKYGNKGDNKIKNEDKFNFLETLCIELGLGLDNGFRLYEHFNHLPDELCDLLSKSIEDAIKFAQKHPETVLTQAYIDEEHGSISYELVLIAEIANEKMNKYYKFAIPISECMNNNKNDDDNDDNNNDNNDNDNDNNGKKYYKAQNILTPKMVVDNVRLNTENATFKQGTWVADIDDVTKSFYKQIDKTWYSNALSNDNNNDESDESKSDESDESESDETDESDESYKIEPPFKIRSISIELGVDIDCYKRQLLRKSTKSTKSTSADMFGFSQDDIAVNSDVENGNTKCDNYDKQSFYQIGLNIHGGSNKRLKRNNRGKYNGRGGFRNNNNNNRYNQHHSRGYHHSNNVYNNNSNNYNDLNRHNSWNNYEYNNNLNNHYYNTNDSYFTHQSEQHSFGW